MGKIEKLKNFLYGRFDGSAMKGALLLFSMAAAAGATIGIAKYQEQKQFQHTRKQENNQCQDPSLVLNSYYNSIEFLCGNKYWLGLVRDSGGSYSSKIRSCNRTIVRKEEEPSNKYNLHCAAEPGFIPQEGDEDTRSR